MQSSYWGGATSPASKAVLCEQSGSFQVSGCGRTSTHPSKCPWSPFYGVTSQRWPNWEWLDSKKPARSFLHGHLLCSRLCFPCHLCMQQMLPAACCPGCSVSSEKPNQRPQVGSVCFCPERSTSLYFTPVCSLTHFTSACVHQALLGKKPLGNTGLYHWKGSEIQLWKQLSFLFSLEHHLYLFLTWQKASIGITLLQEKEKEEWDWNATQAGECCPPKCCFPSYPFSSPLT